MFDVNEFVPEFKRQTRERPTRERRKTGLKKQDIAPARTLSRAELEAELEMRAKFPPIADAIEEEFGALRIGTERKPYLMRPLGSERDSRPYVKGSAPGLDY